jgi:hypothetical protein
LARVRVSFWLEEVLAVVAAEEEGEAVQVAAQSVQARRRGGDVGQQRWRHRAAVGGASCDRRTAASQQAPRYDHHLGGGEPVHDPGSRTRAAAQRAMADRADASVSEIAASRAVYVSQPQVVAGLIKQAAAAVGGG